MPRSHTSTPKPSSLLALVALGIVRRLHPEWIAISLSQAAEAHNISPQRLSRLVTGAIEPFQIVLDRLTQRGRPTTDSDDGELRAELALHKALLEIATSILEKIPLRRPVVGALVVGAWRRVKGPVMVAAGYRHTCAAFSDGSLYCWGQNECGELGNATTEPTRVPGLSDVIAVEAGFCLTCAIVSGGEAFCWGNNALGQLLDGTWESSQEPVEVDLSEPIVGVGPSNNFSCALGISGRALCMGDYVYGNSSQNHPIFVPGVDDATHLAVGHSHACALTPDGVVCWGGIYRDALQSTDTAVLVEGLEDVIQLDLGQRHSCAVTNGGELYCWGNALYGACGNPLQEFREEPSLVEGLDDVVQVALSSNTTCALHSTGGVSCFGYNSLGTLGNGTVDSESHPTPSAVSGLEEVSQISSYVSHICALSRSGRVFCWGANGKGQLGDGTTVNSSVPLEVRFD